MLSFYNFRCTSIRHFSCTSALKHSRMKNGLITMNPNYFQPNRKFKKAARGRFSQKNGLNGNGGDGGAGDIVAGGGYTHSGWGWMGVDPRVDQIF